MKYLFLLPLLFACTCNNQSSKITASATVRIDGSSTLFPLTEAMSEEFGRANPSVRVTVGTSGTGGGFKKFIAGEIDIVDASRPIKPEEAALLKKANRDYLEIPVAYDGITLVVNAKNTWVDHLTINELKDIWSPDSKIKTWKQIRPEWPDRELKLYGPGTDSGTFDYFTEAVVGKARASRSDFTKSEDDNVLIQGVMGDLDSLGYFGFSYYQAHKNKIRALAIKDKAIVAPTEETILKQEYIPLSRALYIYVDKTVAARPDVKNFVHFYLKNAPLFSKEVGFVPLPAERYEALKKALNP